MTLSNQITFIDDLIKEDPEITIREYLEAVQEIDIIEKTQSDMGRRPLDAAKRQMVLDMAPTSKYETIRSVTGLALATICRIIKAAEIDQDKRRETIRLADEQREKDLWALRLKVAIPEKPKPFVRPAAVYSNHSPYGIADTLHQIKTA
jgi:hypothetical protein